MFLYRDIDLENFVYCENCESVISQVNLIVLLVVVFD